jgi:hypothetical protein
MNDINILINIREHLYNLKRSSNIIDETNENEVIDTLKKLKQKIDLIKYKYEKVKNEQTNRIGATKNILETLFIGENENNQILYNTRINKLNNLRKYLIGFKNYLNKFEKVPLNVATRLIIFFDQLKRNKILLLKDSLEKSIHNEKIKRIRTFTLERLLLETRLHDETIKTKRNEIKKFQENFKLYRDDLRNENKGYTLLSDISTTFYEPFLLINSNLEYTIEKNNEMKINLNDFFMSLTGNTLQYEYLLLDNVRSNIKITKNNHISQFENILTIISDYRNTSYNIEIKSKDIFYSKPIYIKIIEENFPIIKTQNNNINIYLGNNNNYREVIDLTSNIYNDIYNFTIFSDKSEYNLTNNLLEIKGSYTNSNIYELNDKINVKPSLIGYPTYSEYYSNEETKINVYYAPKEIITNIEINDLKNNLFKFDLSLCNSSYLYFTSNTTYEIISEIDFYSYNNNILEILPDYRNISYDIKIQTYDPSFITQSNIYNFIIKEEKPIAPIRTNEILYLNREYIYEELEIDLDKFFISPIKSSNISYISSISKFEKNILENDVYNQYYNCNIESNLYSLNQNILKITPNYRFLSYQIDIISKDDYYDISNINEKLSIIINEPNIINIK